MATEFCFQREGSQSIKVGIIPETDNKELRYLTKMGTMLKQKIPFRYDVVSEPSVVIGNNKPRVELTVRPTAVNLATAIGELKAKHFIPVIEAVT